MRSIEAEIFGVVQGVFYRQSTAEEAQRLGLAGWVMNREDGSVLLRAQGEAAAIDALVSWCHKGPERAKVERVVARDLERASLPFPFEVRR